MKMGGLILLVGIGIVYLAASGKMSQVVMAIRGRA